MHGEDGLDEEDASAEQRSAARISALLAAPPAPAPAPAPVPAKVGAGAAVEEQLSQLAQLGFVDRAAAMRALKDAGGDVDLAALLLAA